jgi:CHASE3 domain sensor protein
VDKDTKEKTKTYKVKFEGDLEYTTITEEQLKTYSDTTQKQISEKLAEQSQVVKVEADTKTAQSQIEEWIRNSDFKVSVKVTPK